MSPWYKDHPGIWFTLYSFELWFFYNLWAIQTDIPRKIIGSIEFFIIAMCFYGITVFHVRWLMKIDDKEYRRQKEIDEKKQHS